MQRHMVEFIVWERLQHVLPHYTLLDKEKIAFIDKGIIYNTGGVSLKPKMDMSDIKSDMCGVAGLLGGVISAAMIRVSKCLYLVLCLAENVIRLKAVQNDVVLLIHSGKTVKINNSDTEGHLVLADGVSYTTTYFDKIDLVA
eukprot:1237811-Ditylum_brightwellii.AAC.1